MVYTDPDTWYKIVGALYFHCPTVTAMTLQFLQLQIAGTGRLKFRILAAGIQDDLLEAYGSRGGSGRGSLGNLGSDEPPSATYAP